MSDIFISYARSTAPQAQQIAQALRALGYKVWRDDELPAHRSYAEVIEERLKAAKAVVVIWSAEGVKSEWVQSEADRARNDRKLVQLTVDGTALPMPFDRIQCADLSGWAGDLAAPGWRKVVASIAELSGGVVSADARRIQSERAGVSICVLPFANMSDDREQEYFADGISEDIITDLSKVSALSVISRNSAFSFKGKHVDLPMVARQLNVSHVLEGSVRRSGSRVRITAQLIDGSTNGHIWAERYDRDLSDIFALQDEISEAIVKALKLKLLPEEKKAIEDRGTSNPEAYDLSLRARALAGQMTLAGLKRGIELMNQAIAKDPGFLTARGMLIGMLMDYTIVAPHERASLQPQINEAHRRLIEFSPGDDLPRIMEAMLRGDLVAAEPIMVRLEKSRRISTPMGDASGFRFWLDETAGRFDGPVSIYRERVRQDPLSLVGSTIFQMLLDIAGRWEEAQAEYERSSDLTGDHSPLHLLAFVRMLGRLGPEDITALYKRFLDSRAHAMAIPLYDELSPVLFDAPAARAIVARAIEDPAYQDGTRMAWLALLAGLFGDPKSALIALKRGHIDMEFRPTRLIWHPRLAEARREPGFKEVVRALGLYDYWRRTGKWGDFARPLGEDDFEVFR